MSSIAVLTVVLTLVTYRIGPKLPLLVAICVLWLTGTIWHVLGIAAEQ